MEVECLWHTEFSYSHKHLQGGAVRVHALLHERVERVVETCLADELESGAPHPVDHIDLLRAILDSGLDCSSKLAGHHVSLAWATFV